MNRRLILQILAKLMIAEAVLLLLPAATSAIYGEFGIATTFLIIAAIVAAVSIPFALKKVENKTMYAREGYIIVSVAWILWSLIGALPFFLSGHIPNYIDAFFETVSGFTTTGSTILTNVEILPKGLLFWRSFTHWVGGMGVLIFVMAIVSVNDNSSMHLMRAEQPGPTVGKLVPKGKTTAKILYSMYLGLTVLEIILLLAGGMPVYDSIVHAFGTAGTGGFGIKNSSIAYYNSAYIDGVITVFMLLFSINFNLYFFLLIGKLKTVFKNTEIKAFLAIVALAIAMITINISPIYSSISKAFRYASFQVASIISTTGYATADFNLWPSFSKSILLMLMVLGACAGSTGGGIKITRAVIMFKAIIREIQKLLQPKSIRSIKIDEKGMDEDVVHGALTYMAVYTLVICISTILISLDNMDFTTTFTAVLATFNNIGPGLEAVGPIGNFADFSIFSKIVLSFNMLLGRLEIFPMLMLLNPLFGKR